MTQYFYSVENDFPGQTINSTCLTLEIQVSSITAELYYIYIDNDAVTITFLTNLTAGEEATLEYIVANHDNNCIVQQEQDLIDLSAKLPLSIQKYNNEIKSIVNIINFEGNVNVTDEGDNKVTIEIPNIYNYFGKEASYTLSEDESSTNCSDFINKIEHITEALPAGIYRVGFYAEGIISNSSHEYIINGVVDGIDVFTTSGNDVGNDDIWKGNCGFIYLNFTTEMVHNIKIQWKSSHHTKTASIRKARVEIWRIL